jgi:hypothetical protein
VEEAQQGHVLPPVQRVAHEQHPLAPQHLQHHRRVEAACITISTLGFRRNFNLQVRI